MFWYSNGDMFLKAGLFKLYWFKKEKWRGQNVFSMILRKTGDKKHRKKSCSIN